MPPVNRHRQAVNKQQDGVNAGYSLTTARRSSTRIKSLMMGSKKPMNVVTFPPHYRV